MNAFVVSLVQVGNSIWQMEHSEFLIRDYVTNDESGIQDLEKICPQLGTVSVYLRGRSIERASNFRSYKILVCVSRADDLVIGCCSGSIYENYFKGTLSHSVL